MDALKRVLRITFQRKIYDGIKIGQQKFFGVMD
jgi:hypothetical protein